MKMGKLISRKLFLETEDSQRDLPGTLPVTDTATIVAPSHIKNSLHFEKELV